MVKAYRGKLQFRLSSLLVVTTIAAILAAYASRYPVSRWGGGVELKVEVRSESHAPIDQLLYYSARDEADGELFLKDRRGREIEMQEGLEKNGFFYASIDRQFGVTIFGRQVDHVEDQYVVLQVDYADGSQAVQLLEVPPGRGTRALSVLVP